MPPSSRIYIGAAGFVGSIALLVGTGILPAFTKTPGVSNIEDRFSSGGGTATHVPGAATPTGNKDNVTPRSERAQGVGEEKFKEKIADQRPDPSTFDKQWNQMNYGNSKGK
ncbi:MAG: hypothetical protein M1827_000747 [Pycnora praestabilis]|nr:MAG: hypothetical protein M1827_000747 [Pycnora praestabilis]